MLNMSAGIILTVHQKLYLLQFIVLDKGIAQCRQHQRGCFSHHPGCTQTHKCSTAADLGVLQRSQPDRYDLELVTIFTFIDTGIEYHCETGS